MWVKTDERYYCEWDQVKSCPDCFILSPPWVWLQPIQFLVQDRHSNSEENGVDLGVGLDDEDTEQDQVLGSEKTGRLIVGPNDPEIHCNSDCYSGTNQQDLGLNAFLSDNKPDKPWKQEHYLNLTGREPAPEEATFVCDSVWGDEVACK